jgi:hypothetical protein
MKIIDLDTTKDFSALKKVEILDLYNGKYEHYSEAFVIDEDQQGLYVASALPFIAGLGHTLTLQRIGYDRPSPIEVALVGPILRIKGQQFAYCYQLQYS